MSQEPGQPPRSRNEPGTSYFSYGLDRPGTDDANDDLGWDAPPEGAKIRFMGDYGADVPLWYGGLLFDSADDVVHNWGIDPKLAGEIVTWGKRWETGHGPAHTAKGVELAKRLDEALAGRYRIVFKP